jgi:hypothetical protein
MNKKIIILSVLVVLMLVGISFVSSAETNTNSEKKESPLYGIRTRKAIGEKFVNILEDIKTKFLSGKRMFFLPPQPYEKVEVSRIYLTIFQKICNEAPCTQHSNLCTAEPPITCYCSLNFRSYCS